MCRLAVILLFCGSIFIAVDCAPLDFESNSAANFNVVVVEDFNKYLKENPDVKLVQKLDKLENRIQIRYTLGSRVSGDRLVGDTSNSQSWSSPQDVVLTINYPRTGVGAVISFVQVIVGQTSNIGQAYVTRGGIGQRFIAIVIEAKRTLAFSHQSAIYGH